MRMIIQLIAASAVLAILAGCAGGAGSAPAPEGTTGDVNLGVHNPNAERFSGDDGENGDDADGDGEGDAEE